MKKMGILVGVFALAGLISASALTASAKSQGGERPGWGYGDRNHVHVGPPGQSVHPQATGSSN